MSNHKAPWTLHEGTTHMTVRNNETDSVFCDLKSVPGVREDARLIAAAPDLLDAAQAARAILQACGEWHSPIIAPQVKIIEDAIKKATGGEG